MSELDTMTLFPRAADGHIDLENGNYRDIIPTNMRVSYEKEICFDLGVVMVMTNEGRVKGHRYKAFDYTSKKVIPKNIGIERSKKILVGLKV